MRRFNIWTLAVATVAAGGCSSGPEGVTAPPIEPGPAAEAAFVQYDKSGDGELAEDELAACPALRSALAELDKNGDRRVSKQELTDRLQMWVGSGIGVSFLTVQVTKGGRLLEGATVKLTPEEFLGGAVQPASGVTETSGAARMAIDASNLPDDLQQLRGVQQGYYRVEITHPSVAIPPKYNTQSTQGMEVSFEAGRNFVTLAIP
jgi:hypothetical protein